MSLAQETNFASFHHILSRARRSCLQSGWILLGLLIDAFAPAGPLVLGGDMLLAPVPFAQRT